METKRAINDWYDHALSAVDVFFDVYGDISEEDSNNRSIRCIHSFHDLFNQIAKARKIRDEWPESFAAIYPQQTGVIERSKKMGADFTLGISLSGFYVEVTISHSHRIQNMDDQFWKHIVKLSSLGDAELIDYGHPIEWSKRKEIKELTKFNNSLTYSIIREYVIGKIINEADSSIGYIKIIFPFNSSRDDTYNFFDQAIYHAYRMNYLLYRSAYIEMNRYKRGTKN